tara:strand:+ start:201 stop:551 length:351 start_codon:yes stop_codon:yes gene_type:complete
MLKILLVTILYIIVLFIVSPVLDHAFSPLDKEESNLEIMLEVIGQIITLTVVWYIISEYFIIKLNDYLGLKDNKIIDKARNVISAVIMVGLQTHLVSKLEYLTHRHPFRFLNIYED